MTSLFIFRHKGAGMAPAKEAQPVATFVDPVGRLEVLSETGAAFPGDVWFEQMYSSADLEAIHLPPDLDRPAEVIPIQAVKANKGILQECQILR